MNRRIVALIVMVGSVIPDPAEAGPPSGDRARLAGEWRAVIGPKKDRWFTLEVRDEQVSLTSTSPETGDLLCLRARGVIDEKAEPKRWDWVDGVTGGPGGSKLPLMPSIYKLGETTLTLCIARPGDPRPTDFQGEANRGDIGLPLFEKRSLLIFERRNPAVARAADAGDPAKQAKRFAGNWKISRMESHGVASDVEPLEFAWLKIAGDRLDFVMDSMASGARERGTFAVVGVRDRFCEVDVKVDVEYGSDLNHGKVKGITGKEIWKLVDDDTLQRCSWGGKFSERGRERPKGFSTKAGDEWMVITFKRTKDSPPVFTP